MSGRSRFLYGRMLWLPVLLILLSTAATALQQGVITGDKVRIRATPSTESDANILGALNKGHEVVMVEFQEGGPWVKVQTLLDGQQVEGWVHGDFVDPVAGPPAASADPPMTMEEAQAQYEILPVSTDGPFADIAWGESQILGHFAPGRTVYLLCEDGAIKQGTTGEHRFEIDECNGFRIPVTRITGVRGGKDAYLAVLDPAEKPKMLRPEPVGGGNLESLKGAALLECADVEKLIGESGVKVRGSALQHGKLTVQILVAEVPFEDVQNWPDGAAYITTRQGQHDCLARACNKELQFFAIADRLYLVRTFGECLSGDYNKQVWEITGDGLKDAYTSGLPGC
ncbi:MAG: SH3 domain-containing protein [Candidatus Hydrogenedentes bacterium]|nr:SH3 domain-containing protein [Candidatus Hydrogenedentota bacterium]